MGRNKTSNDTEARINRLAQEFANAYENIAEQIKELSKRIDDNLYKAEQAHDRTEQAPVDHSYDRQRAMDFAIALKPHPEAVIGLAKSIEKYLRGESSTNKLEARLDGYSRGFKHGQETAIDNLLGDYEHLSDAQTVTIGEVRQVLRKRAGL